MKIKLKSGVRERGEERYSFLNRLSVRRLHWVCDILISDLKEVKGMNIGLCGDNIQILRGRMQ